MLKDIIGERYRSEQEMMERRKVKQLKSKELMKKKIEYKKILAKQKNLRLSQMLSLQNEVDESNSSFEEDLNASRKKLSFP